MIKKRKKKRPIIWLNDKLLYKVLYSTMEATIRMALLNKLCIIYSKYTHQPQSNPKTGGTKYELPPPLFLPVFCFIFFYSRRLSRVYLRAESVCTEVMTTEIIFTTTVRFKTAENYTRASLIVRTDVERVTWKQKVFWRIRLCCVTRRI